mmetsp:Transcript_4797/g.18148  ORF Transcript_4797/g.18148 Transcript_4797/m.18148 type:complete len:257 (+) Transcript_4797:1243-2013(+)
MASMPALVCFLLAVAVVPVVAVHKFAIAHDRGEQVVHVRVDDRKHQHLRQRGVGLARVGAGGVVALREPPELLQQEPDLLPVRISTAVLLDAPPHPGEVVVGEALRGRGHGAHGGLAAEVDTPNVPLVLLHALARQVALQKACPVALLLTTAVLRSVDVENRPPGPVDGIIKAAPCDWSTRDSRRQSGQPSGAPGGIQKQAQASHALAQRRRRQREGPRELRPRGRGRRRRGRGCAAEREARDEPTQGLACTAHPP